MRRAVGIATLGFLTTVVPLACGSLNEGQIIIVDEGGAPNSGGTGGSAGKAGGGTAGSTAGKAGSSGRGGSANEGGEAGTGANGGSSGGSKGGTGGSSKGGSNNGGDPGTGGTAGETPTGCTEISDCSGSKPICDMGTCRACEAVAIGAMNDECMDLTNTPHCDGMSGKCVQCLDNSHCSTTGTGSRTVCDQGTCRGCESGSECDSGACNGGRCADASTVVYASDTGSSDPMACGTKERPCDPATAAGLLSGSRPNMVILYTPSVIFTNFSLPSVSGGNFAIFGNGVSLQATDVPVISMSGGTVRLEDVIVLGAGESTGFPNLWAVDCSNTNLTIVGSRITQLSLAYDSVGLRMLDCSADIQKSEFTSNQNAIVSQSSSPTPSQSLTIEQSLFQGNIEAIAFEGGLFLIRNNLFVNNGGQDYLKIIELSGQAESLFAFNTLYGNTSGCNYEGAAVFCGDQSCGRHSSNLFWGNMFNPDSSGSSCPDQLYASWSPTGLPTSLDYSIMEYDYGVGTGNTTADPLLRNPSGGDFTPKAGSPAIDNGETDTMLTPDVDYYGHPRPVGASPDIGAIEVQTGNP